MTRRRLRPAHSPERLTQIYARPHDHSQWADHRLRVSATVEVARWIAGSGVRAAADLSCGDGAVLRAVPAKVRVFGDLAPGYEYTGPIEDTVARAPAVDLFICCETIEHLDDPDKVLKQIRGKARHLVLSTPVDAFDDRNEEHYWAWSREGVEEMLTAARWEPVVYAPLDFRMHGPDTYQFGIWGCR